MNRRSATAVFASLLLFTASAWAEPKVDAFSPQGESKGVRQVAVRFSEPMVEFGDPRLADPFTVRCDGDKERLAGHGRWADTQNWVYDFNDDLPAGQRCKLTLLPDLKSAEGKPLSGRREFSFHTGGPTVVASMPYEGSSAIDEEQAFVLVFDAPVDAASVKDAWCEAAGVNERIPVTAIPAEDVRAILAANRAQAYRFYRIYYKGPRPIAIHDFRIEDKRFRNLPIVGLRCARRLPAGAKLALVIGEAARTKTGIPRGIAQRLAFRVRPDFSVTFRCQKVNVDAQCLPATPMTLDFSAPVPREQAAAIRLVWGKTGVRTATLDDNVKAVGSIRFAGPFPENTKFTVELPKDFRDDSGREPRNAASFPLVVQTDSNPPLIKFPAKFGILEASDPTLPVTVRAVEPKLAAAMVDVAEAFREPIAGRTARLEGDEGFILNRYFNFMKQAGAGWERSEEKLGAVSAIEAGDRTTALAIPRPAAGRSMEVIGIALKKPGFYIIELASPRLGTALHGVKDKPYFVSTSVLVTNLAVHLKHGRESSLVWVTQLSDGKPVADARVSVRDCRGTLLFEGRTDADGVALAGDKLPETQRWPPCPHAAFARVGDDVSFTLSSWREGIEPWNYNMNVGYWRQRPLTIHTIFDRTLFRAGETVSMKHIARVPTGEGFRIPPSDAVPRAVSVVHLGSDQKAKLAVSFDAQGVAETSWKIPKEAKLGSYRLEWEYGSGIRSNAEFRVEAFRIPLMRASLGTPKEPLIKATKTKVDAAVTYLAGGPAAFLPVKVRHRVEPRPVSFADYPDFQFEGEAIKEGVHAGAAYEDWTSYDPDEESSAEAPAAQGGEGPVTTRSFTLDEAGTAALAIDGLAPAERASSLVVEMEYDDPNGERLAASTRVALHAAGLYVGIRPDGWAATKSGVKVQVVAVDTAGRPMAGRAVTIDVYERKFFSNRRRVLGGFYAYDSVTETRKVGAGCSATTDARGLTFCEVKPGMTGELILRARVADDANRAAFATASVWVVGDGEWWFDPSSNDRIDLVPEKRRYEPGETARLQVRMPFRRATVLVTVEREGVLAHKVVTLEGKSPVIEVPIAGHYGPNVYVSALAVRGRVPTSGRDAQAKRPTALVDLAKPAYKLGMAEIKVGWREYELKVKVTPSQTVFRVREKARVAIEVTDSAGKPAANAEVALAAVDEGLLELMDNASWQILDAMLGQRPVEVVTATAQGHVIGKRHFGKKAVAAGGGGGKAGARELFDTLLLWKGRVALDAQGRATVEIPLNDALTSFRIVAVSHQGAAKFGHGQASIRTTQELMLFSGLPPVVREQDELTALFTLRNTTASAIEASLAWTIHDRAASDKARKSVGAGQQRVSLAANEAKLVSLPMKVPVNVKNLHWEVIATAPGDARDRLRVVQEVIEVHPVRVYQATLARLDKPTEFPVERPYDAIPGRGGIRVELMASLAGEMSAVREWFSYYVYTCLEQRASKAIGLRSDALWAAVGASLPSYLDRDGLARYFPSEQLEGSDVLTAYLVQIAAADGREWPGEPLGRMLQGLEAFASGRIVRGTGLPTADLSIRKLAAIEALARHERAKPEMLDAIAIDPARWPTSALIDWIGILKRVEGIRDREERLQHALSILRSRLNFQGTVMTFSTERSDALWWLMVSADVNANRALLAVLEEPAWNDDIGRLVRGSLSRQLRGTWSTTVANAWGTVAMERYAEAFEKTPATGTTVVSMGRKETPLEVREEKQVLDVAWPAGRSMFSLAHKGEGAPWAIVQSRAALPLKEPLSTGYRIRRSVKAVEQKSPGGYSRGDVYRVTLEIDAQTDMTWVVVDDPIPSGAAILGSGLGRDATMLTGGEKRSGWAWPAFVERTHTAYRAYYAFVPKGRFSVDYTVRVNNAGRFDLPATRVEAMYAPEMLGEIPNAPVTVNP